MIDFEALNRELLSQAATWVPQLIPGGRFRGVEYVCASIEGGHGDSFKVNISTGRFADFANTEHRGNDLIALFATVKGLPMREAALALGATDKPNGKGSHLNGHHLPVPTQQRVPERTYYANDFRSKRLGNPSAFWIYRSTEGAILQVVARYETPTGKELMPWTWDGVHWQAKGLIKPRPLFGLENLAPVGPVLLVEGEKTCVAAQKIFSSESCLTWSNGTSGVKHADWYPIKGRAVTIWPDNDDPGMKAAAEASEILLKLGCTVAVVNPEGFPPAWDLADATSIDVRAYRGEHTLALKAPEVPQERRKPVAQPKAAPLQTTTAPGRDTLAGPAIAGSLDELYQVHGFTTKSNGRPHSNEHNVCCALVSRALPVYFDEFKRRVCHGDGAEWIEADTRELTLWLQKRIELYDISVRVVQNGLITYAYQHRRNPLAEWLNGIEWDGTSRLRHLLHKGFGSEDSSYTAAVGRCFLIAMVARVLAPGCKHDCMMVLQGEQGIFKSRALEALAGADYYAEIHDSICSKDFCISMMGKWLCDVNELHAFKTAEIERIKGVISTKVDRYRDPYAATATDHARTSVLTGTTNRSDWNTDETGSRRFWPINCGLVDVDWLKANRAQLFAEAVERYRDGENWWEVPLERAEQMRDASRDVDPWEEVLWDYLDHHEQVRIPHLMNEVLGIKESLMDCIGQRRVGKILRRFGYRKIEAGGGEGRAGRYWTRAPRPPK